MSGKRSATSDLNHDNWAEDEQPEERGTFQKASEDAIKNRVIRTAKRRNPIRSESEPKTSAFAGFTGFTNKPASGDFSFLTNFSSSHSAPKTNGIDKPETTKPSPNSSIFSNISSQTTNIFGGSVTNTVSTSTSLFGTSTTTTSTSNTIVPSGSSGNKKSEQYCAKLKGLNESVSKWIAKKVEENPLISLQPIFKDYEKYLSEIEKGESSLTNTDKPAVNSSTTNSVPTFNFAPSMDKNNKAIADSTSDKAHDKKEGLAATATFKFGAPTASISSSGPTYNFSSTASSVSNSFTFSSTTTSSSTIPTFSFGSKNSSSSLSFPTSSGFSFGGVSKPSEPVKSQDDNKEDENDNEPPKVEFKPVVEKDHIFTTRCKVFVKKGDSFGDRGVGNLYLKPIENSEKVQLIVRADTNLGNLLLNLILSESVPTKRMGKKDVMLVAIPTPDAQPPPVPLLLRVKTPEDADNLLEVLDKHKK